MAAELRSKSKVKPIAAQGYHRFWKVAAVLICSVFLLAGLYMFFISSSSYSSVEYVSAVFCIFAIPSATYAVFALKVRVYSGRIERRRFRTKVVLYEEVERIHLSDSAPERVSVYEEGMSYYPAISIHNGLADWRSLAEALIAETPDTVEITGSEELKSELVHA
jgi:hypothetical protein